MKNQKHNEGDLKTLNVDIEKDLVESFEKMSKNTGMPVADLVCIALKRFRSHHADYEEATPKLD